MTKVRDLSQRHPLGLLWRVHGDEATDVKAPDSVQLLRKMLLAFCFVLPFISLLVPSSKFLLRKIPATSTEKPALPLSQLPFLSWAGGTRFGVWASTK